MEILSSLCFNWLNKRTIELRAWLAYKTLMCLGQSYKHGNDIWYLKALKRKYLQEVKMKISIHCFKSFVTSPFFIPPWNFTLVTCLYQWIVWETIERWLSTQNSVCSSQHVSISMHKIWVKHDKSCVTIITRHLMS